MREYLPTLTELLMLVGLALLLVLPILNGCVKNPTPVTLYIEALKQCEKKNEQLLIRHKKSEEELLRCSEFAIDCYRLLE